MIAASRNQNHDRGTGAAPRPRPPPASYLSTRWVDGDRQTTAVSNIPRGSPAALILFVTYLSGISDEVEAAMPGIRGLSFVDDIGWWADWTDDEAVAAKLSEAAAAPIDWAASNGVAFDHGKMEAAIFRRKETTPTETVKVGTDTVPFNKEATRWLGVWLDSQLTLKDHHAIRLKEGERAMGRLRRLTGQMGLSPANCRKVMTACIQSVAMFGSELWWKGDHVRGTIGQANELKLLVNQEARATTGCFRTTNLGALSMESGLRAVTMQLENRQRRFGLRLLSLPRGDQAREMVGAPTAIGRRFTNALAYAGRTESTVLLEAPETLDAELLQEEEAEAKAEAEKARPGLTMLTDGSRLDDGAAGYAVVWRNGQSWVGIKTYMGYNQEVYDAECAALARALELAPRRQTTRRSGSRSSQTPNPPSDGWLRRSLAQARSTRSRQGSTSPRCGGPGRALSSRSGGARPTRELPATKRPTNGRR